MMMPFAKFLLWPQVPSSRCYGDDGDGWEGVTGSLVCSSQELVLGDSAHIHRWRHRPE